MGISYLYEDPPPSGGTGGPASICRSNTQEIEAPPANVHFPWPPEKGLQPRTWQNHCALKGVGVRYRSAGKLKWKSR
jgi:hypothetical protein